MTVGAPTRREQAKAERRRQLLDAGARLIAERGFRGVRLDDLGAAAGISGPAVYRHFASKEALLVELLGGVSEQLLTGATAITEQSTPAEALERLIDLQLDFALDKAEIIRIHDRDLDYVPTAARRQIRKAQRQYVEVWVEVLRRNDPDMAESDARVAAHGAFGLINSTAHSATTTGARKVLRRMALASLT
jgi:AcrR family transcriptional regulator